MPVHDSDKTQDQLLATVTGEPCQPVRIYYRVSDKNAVNKKFGALKCMQADMVRRRWVWLFDGEARDLEFEKKYRDIPKKRRPIVIGSFYFRPPTEMYLDLRSIERAIHAVPFFDRHLGRRLAEATEFAVVNRLLSAAEYQIDLDHFFADEVRLNLEDRLDQVKGNPLATLRLLEEEMAKPEPEVVRGPLHYYSDGIDSFRASLRLRQSLALERWKGNPATMQSLLEKLIGQSQQPN